MAVAPVQSGAIAMAVPAIILLTFVAAVLGSSAQTTVGFGAALVVSPVMLALLDPAEAVFCTIAQATILSVLLIAKERGRLQLDRGATLGLLLPALPGVFVGVALLHVISRSWLQLAVGAIVLGFIFMKWRWRDDEPDPDSQFRFDLRALPAGFTAGLLNGSVSTGGPPLAIWLHTVRAKPDQVRHTLAVVFTVMNLVTLAVLMISVDMQVTADGRAALLGAVFGVPVGYAVGAVALRRLSEEGFGRVFASLLAAVGVASLVAGMGDV